MNIDPGLSPLNLNWFWHPFCLKSLEVKGHEVVMGMKKILILSFLTASILTACAADKKNRVSVRTNEKARSADPSTMIGPAAAIHLYGKLADINDKSRAIPAKNVSVKIEGSVRRPSVLSREASEVSSNVADAKVFVNFGCTNLDARETSGLTEKKVEFKAPFFVEASRVFLCGALKMRVDTAILVADELIMNEVALDIESDDSIFEIHTNKLTLHGKNVIKNYPVEGTKTPPSELKITVAKDLSASGSLELFSRGSKITKTPPPATDKAKRAEGESEIAGGELAR